VEHATANREPGSDELLSPEAAIQIQDSIWEAETEENNDTQQFKQWYEKHKNEWESEDE
jgi:hypothetical protein